MLYQAAPGAFRLELAGVAKYLVKDGREIVIEPAPDAEDDAVRVFLLGSVMGALLHQRGILPLHASAIEVENRCVIFAGHSGKGKSTLAAAFHQNGYRILADDVLAIRMENGGPPVAYPSYPQLKLWSDALAKLDMETAGLRKTRVEIEKFCVSTGDQSVGDSLPVSHVYLLGASNQGNFQLKRIQGMRKLDALTRHTYRRQFLDGLGEKERHFKLSVALSQAAKVTRVIRPRGQFKLDELVSLVESDFLQ